MPPLTSDEIIRIGELSWQAGSDLAHMISAATHAGDLHTLDALAKVLPTGAVLALQDEALKQQQRNSATQSLRTAETVRPPKT